MNRTSWRLLVVLLPALLVEGCLCAGEGANRGDLNLIGLDEEWALGAQLAQEITQQAPVLDDPAARAFIEKLGQGLVEETELAGRPWRFYVLADPAVNAFNIPGGHVFVNAGLVAAAEDPAEVASVVAHEVAHGIARHSTERMTKAYGLNLIANLVLGEDAGLMEQIAAQLVGSGALAKFSRDDEREADRLGLRFLAGAGYDPAAMASMFERMLALRARRPGAFEQFFSTHPLTEERIESVRAEAATLDAEGQRAADNAAFTRLKERLAGRTGTP